MSAKTIVILGAGVGGIIAANELRRRLSASHRIVLVERDAEHAFAPSFLWLMVGDRRPGQVRRPVRRLVGRGVELVQATAEALDLQNRDVLTSAGKIGFDYLIIALGAELAPAAIPGLEEASESFYTFEGARRLEHRLASFAGGRITVVVASLPYKCPGAPHEGAMLIAEYFRKRGCAGKIQVDLFTPESQPMPVAGPELGAAVTELLKAKNVSFHPLHALDSVDPVGRTMRFQNSKTEAYDLLVAIPPHHPPKLIQESGLGNAAGWAPVSPQTLETQHPGVFAIGDVTAVPLPGRWKPDVPLMLPKAGVFAHAQAQVVTARILAEVEGRRAAETFCGEGYCMLETGEDFAGFAYGNFFAEPSPEVKLRQVGRAWHIGKVLFERWWLSSPGWKRTSYRTALKLGGRMWGIPITV